jgi:hypothetical protein
MSELVDARDNKGRFGPGNKAGKGRPPSYAAIYTAVVKDACSPQDWKQIVERAVRDAKKGNAPARQWLAKYLIGDTDISLVQVNQFQSEPNELSETTLLAFAQLMANVTSALSETQRAEFNRQMLALTQSVTPVEMQETEAYSVDEHGVVSFAQDIRPFNRV